MDYEQMISRKMEIHQKLFLKKINLEILKDKDFLKFLKENADWLKPYAAFVF